MSIDPNDIGLEEEVLRDMSHVVLDIVPLMGASTFVFRLSIVLGRAFEMFSDYLPDQYIVPDELVFEVPLLLLSLALFARSALPIVRASFVTVDELDNQVYEQLFEPMGLKWWQFRCLLATCVDWEDLEPGRVLECESEFDKPDERGNNDDYLYWLYDGEVTASYGGLFVTTIKRTEGKNIDDPSAVGLLADMRFLYKLDLQNRAKRKASKKERYDPVDVVRYPMATIKVGSRGARVMRINSAKLLDLMEHDEQLAASIRALLLKSLQRKVGLLLRSTTTVE
eukprot:CAMPEP_0116561714 /NCGR_PEP_ID=MMETSP0397-20121206/11738_1 /TAXON_ID=216820 /ORGANISM="Cyclophora tenuis, Strain ECT3854" /LENGTH=281 /DNA_ID=CAMNT_0004087891 /DNA_START=661 /DNA_END=1506 /DNA_ORIENTATION=-